MSYIPVTIGSYRSPVVACDYHMPSWRMFNLFALLSVRRNPRITGRWESCVARSFGRYSEWIIVLATSWLLKDAIIRSVDVRSLGDSGESKCPTTGEVLGRRCCPPSPKELHEALDKTREAYRYIRDVPAPKRGVTRPPANNGPHSQQYSEMSLVPLFLWR
jgi:hypothetical protein